MVTETDGEISPDIADFKVHLEETNTRLPSMADALVLYRNYVINNKAWRIPLHRTPYETVSAALAEAWPCDSRYPDKKGYRYIVELYEDNL